MLMLGGCVQPSMLPNINIATARVLDALGIETVVSPDAGCCGAIRLHLNYHDEALDDARRNIDAWWPHVEQGVEAIVMNASGCGATVLEYAHLLRDDPAYAEKAQRIVSLTRDISDVLLAFEAELATLARRRAIHTVAYHPPCTLQHGQQSRGKVERLLETLGIDAAAGRQPSVLRVGRHLFADAAVAVVPVAQAETAEAAGARTADDRLRQHRLHRAPAKRHADSGHPLDPARRASAARLARAHTNDRGRWASRTASV